jgi:hypothetical protein
LAVFRGGRAAADDGVDGTAWPADVEPTTSGAYDPDLYDNDILWADGYFVVWPEKTTPVDPV